MADQQQRASPVCTKRPQSAHHLVRHGHIKGNGKRFLTPATDCEIGVAPELTVGFISMDDRCGSIALYRLLNAPADAHFYTTSAGERDNAVNNLGFVDQGIAGYVWPGP